MKLDEREAEIEVRIPISMRETNAPEEDVCLSDKPLPTIGTQAQTEDAVIVQKLTCVLKREKRKPCLSCTRDRAAA